MAAGHWGWGNDGQYRYFPESGGNGTPPPTGGGNPFDNGDNPTDTGGYLPHVDPAPPAAGQQMYSPEQISARNHAGAANDWRSGTGVTPGQWQYGYGPNGYPMLPGPNGQLVEMGGQHEYTGGMLQPGMDPHVYQQALNEYHRVRTAQSFGLPANSDWTAIQAGRAAAQARAQSANIAAAARTDLSPQARAWYDSHPQLTGTVDPAGVGQTPLGGGGLSGGVDAQKSTNNADAGVGVPSPFVVTNPGVDPPGPGPVPNPNPQVDPPPNIPPSHGHRPPPFVPPVDMGPTPAPAPASTPSPFVAPPPAQPTGAQALTTTGGGTSSRGPLGPPAPARQRYSRTAATNPSGWNPHPAPVNAPQAPSVPSPFGQKQKTNSPFGGSASF